MWLEEALKNNCRIINSKEDLSEDNHKVYVVLGTDDYNMLQYALDLFRIKNGSRLRCVDNYAVIWCE